MSDETKLRGLLNKSVRRCQMPQGQAAALWQKIIIILRKMWESENGKV